MPERLSDAPSGPTARASSPAPAARSCATVDDVALSVSAPSAPLTVPPVSFSALGVSAMDQSFSTLRSDPPSTTAAISAAFVGVSATCMVRHASFEAMRAIGSLRQ